MVFKKYVLRIFRLYLFWGTVYFLPVLKSQYNGNITDSVLYLIKEYIFCTPAYLWYLPAVLLGCTLLILFYKNKFTLICFSILSILLYIIGVCGNSYAAIINNDTINLYLDHYITTRNGLFFAPIFISIGAICWSKGDKIIKLKPFILYIGIILSYLLFCIEVYHVKSLISHDIDSSMYFSLPLICAMIFCGLLSIKEEKVPDIIQNNGSVFREASIIIYCLQYGIAYILSDYSSVIIFIITIFIGTMFPVFKKLLIILFKK